MTHSFDVLVIGAGIAGLSIARELSKHNLNIGLLDKKSDLRHVTFYTLGSFIDLEKFGLSKNVIAAEQTEGIFHSPHFQVKKLEKRTS